MAIYLSLLPVSHPHVTLTDVLRVTNAASPARLASGGKSSPLLERTAASRHPLSCGPRAGQGEGFPPRRAGRPPAAAQCKHLVGPRGALWPLVLPQKGRAATPAQPCWVSTPGSGKGQRWPCFRASSKGHMCQARGRQQLDPHPRCLPCRKASRCQQPGRLGWFFLHLGVLSPREGPRPLLAVTLGWQGQEPLGCLSRLGLSALAHAVPAPGTASPAPCGALSRRPHRMALSGQAWNPRRLGGSPLAPPALRSLSLQGDLASRLPAPCRLFTVSRSQPCSCGFGFGDLFMSGRPWLPAPIKPAPLICERGPCETRLTSCG